jgi:transposase InsO family protein
MCQVLQVSRSGYYDWRRHKKRSGSETLAASRIKSLFLSSNKTYGTRRLKKALLVQYGMVLSRRRIGRLMREMGLFVRKRKTYPRTTDSRHNHPVADNLLQKDFNVQAPNRVYVGDITYIPTRKGWVYLATVIDLFARSVVGFSLKDSLATPLVIDALQKAAGKRTSLQGAVFHSDRGSQYASKAFRRQLATRGMRQSMSAKGDCYDNAVAESFFHTLKTELVHHQNFQTKQEAKEKIEAYIDYYNRTRLHSYNGYISPMEKECRWWQAHGEHAA